MVYTKNSRLGYCEQNRVPNLLGEAVAGDWWEDLGKAPGEDESQ